MRRLVVLGVFAAALTGGEALHTADLRPQRSYNGTGNHEDPTLFLQGSAGSLEVRRTAGSAYTDDVSEPPGADRPTAREVLSEVFLSSKSEGSTLSVLFVAFWQLVLIDLQYLQDDPTSPLDIPCNAGAQDIWCPFGAASADIPFNRSLAGIDNVTGASNPINYATAYLDLDFLYGRSEEEALALRTGEGGMMALHETSQLPLLLDDGTWLVGDQRTAEFAPVFALHVILLREHNRYCSGDVYDGIPTEDLHDLSDEELFQACRRWTVAAFQHIFEYDFFIALLAVSVEEAIAAETSTNTDTARGRRLSTASLFYDPDSDPQMDVFTGTAALLSVYSMLPTTIRLLDEDFLPESEDNIALSEARADLVGLVSRNGIEPILRGASFGQAQAMGASFKREVSNASPLFALPVFTVQRGRDHGLPSYNAARTAYGLAEKTSFSEITTDANLVDLMSTAYGGDVDLVDAYTGGLAEDSDPFVGELFEAAITEQLLSTVKGDFLFHSHANLFEGANGTTLADVMHRNFLGVSSFNVSRDVFHWPDYVVGSDLGATCKKLGAGQVQLSTTYRLEWAEDKDNDAIGITLVVKGLGDSGMLAIGFGGTSMIGATDFVVCEVTDISTPDGVTCTDSQPVSGYAIPEPDAEDSDLPATVSYDARTDETSVTFTRGRNGNDDDDYPLLPDMDANGGTGVPTSIIFSWREGSVGQHPNSQRGDAGVNLRTGESVLGDSASDNYYILHGSFLLMVWLILVPIGFYFVRYKKGESFCGFSWVAWHSTTMMLVVEALAALAVTAIFATDSPHNSAHAKGGFYMVVAVAVQLITGKMRVRALEGKKDVNFSMAHQVNKLVHVWSGRVAIVWGFYQCYLGLLNVAPEDSLVFEGEPTIVPMPGFGTILSYVYPVWMAVLGTLLLACELHLQLSKLNSTGVADLCCFKVLDKNRGALAIEKEGGMGLIARPSDVPVYTHEEFNSRVAGGSKWVIADRTILDLSAFVHAHPGGARMILNHIGTDISNQLRGLSSVGGNPHHKHSQRALDIGERYVVGRIKDEEVEERGDDVVEGAVTMIGETVGAKVLAAVTKCFQWTTSTTTQEDQAPPHTPAASMHMAAAAESDDEGDQGMDETAVPPSRVFKTCPVRYVEQLSQGDRPVWRFVFSLPGTAMQMGRAARGIGYFNMRMSSAAGLMVQRSYNAFAVRVEERQEPGDGQVRITPAAQTRQGERCIEMRIRLYPDGAMSRLLAELTTRPDVCVQLRGPFDLGNLTPPPVHKKVVMVAAGTGINPMVQIIRSYTGVAAQQAEPSQLVLLWQVAHEGDIYLEEELQDMQDEYPSFKYQILVHERGTSLPAASSTEPQGVYNPAHSGEAKEQGEGSGGSAFATTPAPPVPGAGGEGAQAPPGTSTKRVYSIVTDDILTEALGTDALNLAEKIRQEATLEVENEQKSSEEGLLLKEVTVQGRKLNILRKDGQDGSTSTKARGYGSSEQLMGNKESGLELQVVVSGPGGFVHEVDGILSRAFIPPAAIVRLD